MPGHCYQFAPRVAMPEVEASLMLSIWACEALHGESQVRLEANHVLDEDQRTVLIDADSAVGRDLNQLFVGFLRREFPPTDFRVERVDDQRPSHSPSGTWQAPSAN